MALPTIPISTEYLNAETDDPNLARLDLEKLANSFNALMLSYNVPNGLAILDSHGMLPTAQMSNAAILEVLSGGDNDGLNADTVDHLDSSAFLHADGTIALALNARAQIIQYSGGSGSARSTALTFSNLFAGAAVGFGINLGFVLQAGAPLAAGNFGIEWNTVSGISSTSAFVFETRTVGTMEVGLKYYNRRFEFLELASTPAGGPTVGSNKWWLYFLPAGLFIKDDNGVQVQIGAGTTVDHGTMTGLTDDDHTQYVRVDGTRAMTGNLLLGGNLVRFTDRATPAAPSTGQVYLYSKGGALYYLKPSGVEIGPLGTGGTGGPGGVNQHSQLIDLGLNLDDHKQYLLRQPTADVVINSNGGDFNFRIAGNTVDALFFLDAGTDTIGIAAQPSGLGRLEVTAAGGFAIAAASTTQAAVFAVSTTGTTLWAMGQAQVFLGTRNVGVAPTVALMQLDELGGTGFRLLDVNGRAGTDTLRVRVGTVDALRVTGLQVVVNDTSSNYDFFVKGMTVANLFNVSALNDVVGVGISTTVARFNVAGGNRHGIYASTSTAAMNAAVFESSQVVTYAVKVNAGTFGGRGQGISVTSITDETATFIKTLSGAAVAAYAVKMSVAGATDTAHALHILNSGTGDTLRCEATTGHLTFRVVPAGGSIWEDRSNDLDPPAGTNHALYFKSGGLYVKAPGAVAVGPLGISGPGGVAGGDHGTLDATSMLDNDHPQYVLRQPIAPATETVINDAAGNFNFRMEGLATPNLFFLHATNNSIGINMSPSASSRLEITSGTGRIGVVIASIDSIGFWSDVSAATGTAGYFTTVNRGISVQRNTGTTPTAAAVQIDEAGAAGFRLFDINGKTGFDVMQVKIGTFVPLLIKATQFVVNSSQSAYDFIVRSTTAQLLTVSAANNAVWVGPTTAIGNARFAVTNDTTKNAIYALSTNDFAYAAEFEAQADNFALNLLAGGGASGGVGSAMQASSARSEVALFRKYLGPGAPVATNAVIIQVEVATDTANVLHLQTEGPGECLRCEGPYTGTNHYVFRVMGAGGTLWENVAADMPTPVGYCGLYFRGDKLYYRAPSSGLVTGPLGTGTGGSSDHNALSNLAVGDVHTQYVLRQPAVSGPNPTGATIINNAALDFDFVVKGNAQPTLFMIDAGLGVVAINGSPFAMSTTLGRFQVISFDANPGITASSQSGAGLYASTTTGIAISTLCSDAGQAAKFIRNTATLSLLPAVAIQDGTATVGSLALDVVQVLSSANIANFRHLGSTTSVLTVGASEVVVNDNANAYTFRVEGTTASNLFRVQGGNNSVGINCIPGTSGWLEMDATGKYGITIYATNYPALYATTTTAQCALFQSESLQAVYAARGASVTPTVAVMEINETGSAGFRVLDVNGRAATDLARFQVGAVVPLFIRGTWVTFNDSASNYDFLIKGMTAMQLFNVTAASDVVNINGALTDGRLNVQSGTSKHGIHVIGTSTVQNAMLIEQQVSNWAVWMECGNVVGGLGRGLSIITNREEALNIVKTSLGEAPLAGTCASIAVNDSADTAHVLYLQTYGTGDVLRCQGASSVMHFRVPSGGGTYWSDRTSNMTPAPGTNQHALFFKNDGLYVQSPSGTIGPLGTGGGGGTAGALSAITAAVSANTISSGSNAQSWTWNLGATTNTAFTIAETAAATAFSSLMKVIGVASSLATTFTVTNDPTGRTFYIENGLSRINSRRISIGPSSAWLAPQGTGYDEFISLAGDFSPNSTYSTATKFTVFNTAKINLKFTGAVTNEDLRSSLFNIYANWDTVLGTNTRKYGYVVDVTLNHKNNSWEHAGLVCSTLEFTNRVAGGVQFGACFEGTINGWTNANAGSNVANAIFYFRSGVPDGKYGYEGNVYAMPTTGATTLLYGLKLPCVTMGDYEQWRPIHVTGASGISGHGPRMAIGGERSSGEWWGFPRHSSLTVYGWNDRPGATTRHYDDGYIIGMLDYTGGIVTGGDFFMDRTTTTWRSAFFRTGGMRLWPSIQPNSYLNNTAGTYAYVSATRFSCSTDQSAVWLSGRKFRCMTTASAGAWVYGTVSSYDAAPTPDQVVVAGVTLDSGFTSPEFEDAEGCLYASSADHKLYFNNGTAWLDLTAGGGGGGGGWQDDGTVVRLTTVSDQVVLGGTTSTLLARLTIQGENSVYDRVGIVVLPWNGSSANSFEVRDSTGGYILTSIACGYAPTGQLLPGVRATGYFRLQHILTDGSNNLTGTIYQGEFLSYSTGAKLVIGGLNQDFNTGNSARNLLVIANGVTQILTPGNAVTFYAKDETGLGAAFSFPKFRAEDGRDRTIIGADAHTFTLSTGVGNVKMAGTTTRTNDGFLQINREDGVLIQIPYWITITG